MKRTLSISRSPSQVGLLASGVGLIAATYGLVRFSYGLLLPEMQEAVGFGDATAGAISAGASVAYCVGALAGFAWASRAPRRLVAAAGLSAGTGAAGVAAAASLPVFAGFAILGSVGAGLASPALVAVLQRNVARAALDRKQTIVNAGTGPGLIAAGLACLILLPDWRMAWVVAAVATAASATLVLTFDRGDTDRRADPPQILPPASWVVAHRRLIAAALLMGAGSAAVWNYGRTLLVDTLPIASGSVLAWVAIGVGGTVVIWTAGPLSARRPGTAWTVTVGIAAAATAVLVTAPHSVPVAFLACLAFGWGYVAGSGALIAWTSTVDAARAPAGTALLFVVLVLGQAVGAAVEGALIGATNHEAAFAAAAATLVAAALLGVSTNGVRR